MENNISKSERCVTEITKAADKICEETNKLRDVAIGRVRLLEAKGTENGLSDENMKFLQEPFDLDKLKSLFGALVIENEETSMKPVTLGEFSMFCHNKGVAVSLLVSNSNGHVWTCDPNMTIRLSDNTGTSIFTKKLKFTPESLAVSSSKDLFMASYKEKMVKRLQPDGKVKNVLDTSPLRPVGVSITKNGDLLLCLIESFDFDSQNLRCDVVKIKMEENMTTVNSMTFKDSYALTVPYRITENANNDVIVIDGKTRNHGNIVAFTQDGDFHFVYSGEIPDVFCPVAVCTDSKGNILVIDAVSDSIHVLDDKGNLKTKILATETGSKMMTSLSVGDDGYLWVGHKSGEITRFNWTGLE